MPSRRAEELRELSREELERRLKELRAELFVTNTKSALGSLEKVHRRRQIRRDIGRILTIMRERGYC